MPALPPDVAAAGELPSADGGPGASATPTVSRLKTASDFGVTDLASKSGLVIQVTPGGALFAIRHGGTLLNQFIPGPAENGFFRLIVRWRAPDGSSGWSHLTGAGVAHRTRGPSAIDWTHLAAPGLWCRATLTVHPEKSAWAWRVQLSNTSAGRLNVDILMAQDLGLADEAAVRNSEAFTSQYIDILPAKDRLLGWILMARQNQPAAGGLHPWLAIGCTGRAAAFSTDARQFFGSDHRLTEIPRAVRCRDLPSRRLQYECAMPALQSAAVDLDPGASSETDFVARYLPDHPGASAASDTEHLREILPLQWALGGSASPGTASPFNVAALARAPSLFASARWLHGEPARERDWSEWFPGPRRHEERGEDGALLSFFHAADTHVVAQEKEARVARPHGHILRSGGWRWIDSDQFGVTSYAAGIFAAQAYLGNPTFGRLLPVVRDSLGLGRSAGQRVFVRRGGDWCQLGVPSAFAMTPAEVRWIYRIGTETVFARVWCSRERPAAFLELRSEGRPAEFLITHTLVLGPTEYEHSGEIRYSHEEAWASCTPDPASVAGRNLPGLCFAIAAAEPGAGVEMGGDEMLFPDGRSVGHPCLAMLMAPAGRVGVILCAGVDGAPSLPALVEEARHEWRAGADPAGPPRSPVSLGAGAPPGPDGSREPDPGVARLQEMLPWLAHNAAIHFSAPHGLEQYGGAAWGVRDVCQGSLEWLLAACEWPLVRRMLETVFSQQYARDGGWPQWFMHPPYRAIQQAQSHGDVCFWPVKALCDYLEASNDLAFLDWKTGYTDPEKFEPGGPAETLLEHCDRVIGLCEARFVAGTALVNYGDGDWDDTLQPADPSMRTHMASAWTVALAFHTFRQLAQVCRRAGHPDRAGRLEALLGRIRRDFAERMMPDGVVAGFLVVAADGKGRPLLHPQDSVTGIRYRLLPMSRSILAELFTPEEAVRHAAIVVDELLYPDGARLMSEPAAYAGGLERLFKRADTAANVGREIGLMYVHAHLRYAEAMAKLGEAAKLWEALQVVNPVGLREVVAQALPRQSNVYFSSSDADFRDRIEAAQRWGELRSGSVRVRGGWRLYSSGPGLFIHSNTSGPAAAFVQFSAITRLSS